MSRVLLSTAYLPPVSYFEFIRNYSDVTIEGAESYQKQTYRTRCYISSGNGPLLLNVPVKKLPNDQRFIRDLQLDYHENWPLMHQRGLVSSYNSSPFFEYYYYDDILPVYEKKHKFLFDMNLDFIQVLSELFGLRPDFKISEDFLVSCPDDVIDLRQKIHPKRESVGRNKPYYQVFADKYGFQPELSAIDLLFNEGPDSISYL